MHCTKTTIIVAGLLGASAASVSAQTPAAILATATVVDTRLEWATQSTAAKAGQAAFAQGSSQRVGPATIIVSKAARKEGTEESFDSLVTIAYW